jgi:hypothetical protein
LKSRAGAMACALLSGAALVLGVERYAAPRWPPASSPRPVIERRLERIEADLAALTRRVSSARRPPPVEPDPGGIEETRRALWKAEERLSAVEGRLDGLAGDVALVRAAAEAAGGDPEEPEETEPLPEVKVFPAPEGARDWIPGRPESVWAEVSCMLHSSSISIRAALPGGGDPAVDWQSGYLQCFHRLLWSPDGRYLVYQEYNCEGHQPYREPTTLVDLKTTASLDLETAAARAFPAISVVTGDFEGGPDDLLWRPDGRLRLPVIFRNEEEDWSTKVAVYDPREGKLELLEDGE